LQYPQLKLQNRAGTICTSTGCPVCSSALATILSSRTFRVTATHRPCNVFFCEIAISFIESHAGAIRHGSLSG